MTWEFVTKSHCGDSLMVQRSHRGKKETEEAECLWQGVMSKMTWLECGSDLLNHSHTQLEKRHKRKTAKSNQIWAEANMWVILQRHMLITMLIHLCIKSRHSPTGTGWKQLSFTGSLANLQSTTRHSPKLTNIPLCASAWPYYGRIHIINLPQKYLLVLRDIKPLW